MAQYQPFLKICGVTNADDARLISASGADYCGVLVHVAVSPRSLSLDEAVRVAGAATIPVVVLQRDEDLETVLEVVERIQPAVLQLHGGEPPERVAQVKARWAGQVWKAVHFPAQPGQGAPEDYVAAGADALLVDSVEIRGGVAMLGGTGKVGDWAAAADLVRRTPIPVILAGGIKPGNVAQAVREVRPAGVDLSSGVELIKGKKDPALVKALVENLRNAVESTRSANRADH
jgi:phosphoribosylanthranilate isomerase